MKGAHVLLSTDTLGPQFSRIQKLNAVKMTTDRGTFRDPVWTLLMCFFEVTLQKQEMLMIGRTRA